MSRRTFADAVPVKRLSSHTYSTTLEQDWAIGAVPNGGYVTSAFLIVARTHMSQTHPSRSSPHPINVHLEFLRRTSASEGIFTVQDVKLGRRISNLHITLSQRRNADDPDSPIEDKVQGYVTMSNISTEEGLSLDSEYRLYPPALSVQLSQLGKSGKDANWALRGHDPFAAFRRATEKIQIYVIQPDRRKEAKIPLSAHDQWVRFTPDGSSAAHGRWTNDALGFLVDMFPQTVERFINSEIEADAVGGGADGKEKSGVPKAKAPYWYPTLVLNLEVKKLLPAEGVEWLFVRVRAKAIKNGRFDLDIEVWDEAGELVATSVHASLIVDAARNLAGRKPVKSKI